MEDDDDALSLFQAASLLDVHAIGPRKGRKVERGVKGEPRAGRCPRCIWRWQRAGCRLARWSGRRHAGGGARVTPEGWVDASEPVENVFMFAEDAFLRAEDAFDVA